MGGGGKRKGGRGGVRQGKGVTHGINTSELKPADDTREAIAGCVLSSLYPHGLESMTSTIA